MGGGTVTTINPAYSTEPVRVGTWIDGSPVYRVAFEYTLTNDDKQDKAAIVPPNTNGQNIFFVNHHLMLSYNDTKSAINDVLVTQLQGVSAAWDDYAANILGGPTGIYGYVDYVQLK